MGVPVEDESEPVSDHKKTSISVIAIRHPNTGGFLCVTNRRYGGFCLPGGKIEPGEMPHQAAARELREETGIVAHKLQHVGDFDFVWEINSGGRMPLHIDYFTAELDSQQPRQMEAGTKPFWGTRDSLLSVDSGCISPVSCAWLMGRMGW